MTLVFYLSTYPWLWLPERRRTIGEFSFSWLCFQLDVLWGDAA